MYLLDANIVLEILLNRAKADEVERFLNSTDRRFLHVTDMAVFSIGIVLQRERRAAVWGSFVESLATGGINIIRLNIPDYLCVDANAEAHKLDFDDAYQYTAAEKHNLTIVSFDRHFDTTPLGRRTPGYILHGT